MNKAQKESKNPNVLLVAKILDKHLLSLSVGKTCLSLPVEHRHMDLPFEIDISVGTCEHYQVRINGLWVGAKKSLPGIRGVISTEILYMCTGVH